jgi:peptide/nickel transport system substrate-binding protein
VVPLFTPKNVDFVSARLGNYEYAIEYGMILDQAWVK